MKTPTADRRWLVMGLMCSTLLLQAARSEAAPLPGFQAFALVSSASGGQGDQGCRGLSTSDSNGGPNVTQAISAVSLSGTYTSISPDGALCHELEGRPFSGSAFASADGGTGTLKVAAAIKGVGAEFNFPAASSAHANLNDTLFFEGQMSGVVFVPFDISVTGTAHGAKARIDVCASTDPATGFTCETRAGFSPVEQPVTITMTKVAGVSSELPELFIGVSLSATVEGPDSAVDLTRTLHISLRLPSGVTFTSASGVFLTQSEAADVPEPAPLLLVGFGIAAIGSIRRLRAVLSRGLGIAVRRDTAV